MQLCNAKQPDQKSKTSNLVGFFCLFVCFYLIKEHFRIPVTGKKNEGITFLTPAK